MPKQWYSTDVKVDHVRFDLVSGDINNSEGTAEIRGGAAFRFCDDSGGIIPELTTKQFNTDSQSMSEYPTYVQSALQVIFSYFRDEIMTYEGY